MLLFFKAVDQTPSERISEGRGRQGFMAQDLEASFISKNNLKGLVLALLSSLFIGVSFILKKKGLKRAGASGVRAGVGGYSYLYEPLWWLGLLTMVIGEVANFIAYAFSPAILVTPLGALSIIVSAALAHVILNEKLVALGALGCVMCVVGSVALVVQAPQERSITSVAEVWELATQPAFLVYTATVVVIVLVLVFYFAPRCGQTHVMVYVGICSLMGSLSVMSVKALGIGIKLTFEGENQFLYSQTWFFVMVVTICVLTQMNYLNMALDTFNTAVVSPIYYVMFTSFTILASVIMFKDWAGQSGAKIVSEICGFMTILSGTILLHASTDLADSRMSGMCKYSSLSPSLSIRLTNGVTDAIHQEDEVPSVSILVRRQEPFLSP